ncbi:LPS assembly lipoprotein LptE [Candidatus Erwinia haradaeae]|uniref:LPS-assembly lipoprotein LptE n=1 Tax=Candidatus Erwinia haradaeae TaxID=1922217 RepID=A0A451D281_9GAMM|nr:LPS assembly lipoprotein LptE [Candidatus Erwinia haradaeae]VFP79754.1 LPS-assembly lipoprotein LptE [Candidatus Erwinia haradaeae]
MKKFLLSILLYIVILCVNTSCGYSRYPIFSIPAIMRTLSIDTEDPYGPLATAVCEELRLHNINILDNSINSINTTSLRLQKENISHDTIATFQNGKTSAYIITMTIIAQIIIPHQSVYPLTSTVSRSFFDHPNSALAKDTEQNIIIHDMRKQAVENLVRQFSTLDNVKR